jgi:hypothetical protein
MTKKKKTGAPRKKTGASRKRQTWAKKNGDFIAIGFLSAMLTALGYFALISDTISYGKPFNFGFYANWDCQPVVFGEPICIWKR